jgi:UDP-N-acetylglucosamine 4,6-dehydratase/5-epimerase
LIPFNIVGDRVGDKLHETLISKEEATHTLDLGDKYVIYPEDPHYSYSKPKGDNYGSSGYTSDNNEEKLTIDKIKTTLESN